MHQLLNVIVLLMFSSLTLKEQDESPQWILQDLKSVDDNVARPSFLVPKAYSFKWILRQWTLYLESRT